MTTHPYASIEAAVDEAKRILSERFDEPDQLAIVRLAETLYAASAREEFHQREDKDTETPYNA